MCKKNLLKNVFQSIAIISVYFNNHSKSLNSLTVTPI